MHVFTNNRANEYNNIIIKTIYNSKAIRYNPIHIDLYTKNVTALGVFGFYQIKALFRWTQNTAIAKILLGI